MSDVKRGRGTFDGWSKSSLKSLLEGCSWQWALQRIGGLSGGSTPHSAAGTGMHAAIEYHEQCRIDGVAFDEAMMWESAAREAWEDGSNIPAEWHRIHGDQRTAVDWAMGLTETWYGSEVRSTLLTYTPIAVEPHVEVPVMKDYPNLRGYLDWFGRDEDGVATVVDYKSASNLKRWGDWKNHLVEASVYLYLVSASGMVEEDEPVRMEWHVMTRKGEADILRGPTFDGDLAHFVLKQIEDAQSRMDEGRYLTNPSWGLCSDRWCTFYHGCQVSGTLSPENITLTTSPQSRPSTADAGGGGNAPLPSET